MILIPFFWDTRNTDWIQFGAFLCSGGRQYWSVDDSSGVEAMLTENGFPVCQITVVDDIIFAEIDYEKMSLDDFYLWSDIDPKSSDQDIWRLYKIPVALWSCPVFKEHFWKTSGLLDSISRALEG
jgi:hypothetical protein